MKKYTNKYSYVPTLHVYIDLNDADTPVAASVEFREMRQPSIKRKLKRSDEWLKQVNDLAKSLYSSMVSRGFEVTRAEPSKRSYTYYIRFQPCDRNGDLWDQTLELQIELRDHVSKTHDDIGQLSKDLFVKAFYLEDAQYKNMWELFRQLRHILDDLQDGDFSSFAN